MAALTKADVLSRDVARSEVVEVPEWGGEVTVRGLTAAQRFAIEQAQARGEDWLTLTASIAVIDSAGNPLLTLEEMSERNPLIVARLASLASNLSRLGEVGLIEAKKPSEKAPRKGSRTGSR